MEKTRLYDLDPQFGSDWQNTVKLGCSHLGVYPEEKRFLLFAVHASLLIKWNKKVNLTSILDPLDIAVKHFVDSAALIRHIPSNARVLDIGTGAGFPSIPLKIVNPSLEVTCVDASRKKISFVKESIRQCGLEKILAMHARAEDLSGDQGHQHAYDVVTSRAFSSLEDFSALASPFLAPNGTILAMKGKGCNIEDFSNIFKKSFRISTSDYRLPFLDGQRCLIKLRPRDDSS